MDSISNKNGFTFEELMYWTAISFTISLVMWVNYLFLIIFNNSGISYRWIELAIMTIVFGGILVIVTTKKILLRFISFLLLISPTAFMIQLIVSMPFIERNLLYFGLLPMLLLLMGILYKKVFSSFSMMILAFIVAGIPESYLFPVTYNIEIINVVVSFYIAAIFVDIYRGAIEEEDKTVTTAINTVIKVFLWPGYFVRNLLAS